MPRITRSQPTIGSYLERARLERRAARTASALSALRLRAAECRIAGDPVPAALRLAIADFDAELSGIRESLAGLQEAAEATA